MPIRLRPILISLLLLVVVGGLIAYFEPSENSESLEVQKNFSIGECDHDGVSLVIDFGTSSPSQPLVRCAKDFSGSGWDLFRATGIEAEGTNAYPIGFVCRLAGYPLKADQDCQDTPRYSEGSWGYYLLNKNGTWRVSGVGAAFSKPACGLAEGWRFIEAGEDVGGLTPRITPRVRTCSE